MDTPVRAFLSCRYDRVDRENIVGPIKRLIESCGIKVYEVDRAGVSGDLSTAIINGIKHTDMFIAVVTSDGAVNPEHTRPWVVAEMAVARSFGKEIVIFQDDRVQHSNLGVAFGLTPNLFNGNQPLEREDTMSPTLENVVGKLQKTVRIARNDALDERIIKVELPARESVAVRELVVGDDRGRMSWEIFIRGYEILAQQFDEMKSIPVDLWVGVNATGCNIASYLFGRLDRGKHFDIRLGTVRTTSEDPDTKKRNYYLSLPPKKVLSHIKHRKPSVIIVDSQLKSGRSQSKVRQKIQKHFSRELRFYHVALIANGVRSPTVDTLEMSELFSSELNTNEPPPTFHPSFLAYISMANIKPPEGLP